MNKQRVEITPEVKEIMSYLSTSFAKTMHSPVYDRQDLYNDLVVYYLESYKKSITKNEWFIRFKHFLINKYQRVLLEKRIYEKVIKELKRDSRYSEETSDERAV